VANSASQYTPLYRTSWALVIGINKYTNYSPLDYACNDARGIAKTLIEEFGFQTANVEILLDEQATKAAILQALLRHADAKTANADDRGLVFFAGHGYTAEGRRGEVGYLVPEDGNCDDLASMIRWDELTRSADLLPAKHVFFIMDACYGGLAVTRHIHPGTRRFLKDMLCRTSRQVLTAGKADQPVSDGNGPRPGNSIFTGHLLEALYGGAATKDGYITANGVMAYVYDRVSKDEHSQQTPHYGFIDGDGDFVFSKLPADLLADDERGGKDVLIDVPGVLIDQMSPIAMTDPTELLKEYLAEARYRIKLDDLVSAGVRRTLNNLGTDRFPLSTKIEEMKDDFRNRLAAYEEAIQPLQPAAILLGKWAQAEQQPILANLLARLSDSNTTLADNGPLIWLGLRWYPISFLMYTAGVAAIAAGNYESLAVAHTTKIASARGANPARVEIVVSVVEQLLEVQRSNAWKTLPGHERHYTPHSEYMFKAAQPMLEDILFLGASYEQTFDRLEIFRALIYADVVKQEGRFWGPVGRFGWKYTNRCPNDPFTELCAEAELRRDDWAPLKAGLFRGSYLRFHEISSEFEREVLRELQWH
jgi:hypothetical protein